METDDIAVDYFDSKGSLEEDDSVSDDLSEEDNFDPNL